MDEEDFDIMDSDDAVADLDDDDDEEQTFVNTDDEALGFARVTSDKDKKKDYEVDFSLYTSEDINGMIRKDNQELSNLLGIKEEEAFSLLRHFHWKQDRLIEMYMDNPDAILIKAGLKAPNANHPAEITTLSSFSCDICCNEAPNQRVVSLNCGHRFCADCYRSYIKTKMTEEGESRVVCMANKCGVVIPDSIILQLVPKPLDARLHRLQQDNFMRDHEYLKWCPSPNCDRAVECHVPNSQLNQVVPTVVCACGYIFCFGCGVADHQPAICAIAKKWLKKCADDSETANWIHVNTKECPKCHATIEKNGGCNHMHCKKCKYEFCWVCQGPWTEHGSSWYTCNRFDEKTSEEARGQQAKSRQALERYLHFYARYHNHDSSAKLEQELYSKIEKKMAIMQATTDLSWIEVQFLKRAADTLFLCRMTLKWTYAFAFYLKSNNQTHIFEDNQRDLEMAVENLSGLLEQPIERENIPKLRQQVLDKTVYVASRREVLLSDTARGLLEDRWQYNEDPAPFK